MDTLIKTEEEQEKEFFEKVKVDDRIYWKDYQEFEKGSSNYSFLLKNSVKYPGKLKVVGIYEVEHSVRKLLLISHDDIPIFSDGAWFKAGPAKYSAGWFKLEP